MKEFINNLKFTWNYTKNEKTKLILYCILNIGIISISIVSPILGARRIVALTNNMFDQLLFISLLLLIVNILDRINQFFSNRLTYSIYRNTLSYLGIDLSKNILKLNNKTLDSNGSGVFIQRLTGDTSRMSDAFNRIFDMLSEFISYIGIIIALFTINKIFFFYVLFTVVFLTILENYRVSVRNKNDKIARKSNERVTSFIGELVRGARDIKMLNSEEDFIKELSYKIKDVNEKKYILQKVNSKFRLFNWSLYSFFEFLLVLLLLYFMRDKGLLPATALVVYNYSGRLASAMYMFGNVLEYVKDFNLSSERVSSIINSDEFEKEKFGNVHLDKVNGDFEFKNVEFKYDKDKILKGLNFKINANETVAFVGKSGSGKTTIFNLLCKMYEPTKGNIYIDGVNINKLDKESIRGNITIISQNPYIFNLSIRDNLRLVKSDLTESEMIDACKVACLHDFIMDLPDKYDTIVGEGGVNLSGGQKQRLAIARALVQKTEIILFDEATSALDNETQSNIQKAIENMKNEYTIMIIAHRLSTIINSDRIIFINDGKIEAEGTHEDLLKNCLEYKKLYNSEISK